jgi:elongation factor P
VCWKKTYKSGETLPRADIEELELQYLYHDDEFWYFMSLTTFEQSAVPVDVIAETKKWLLPEDRCTVIFWNHVPISVMPANFVVLSVTETDPGLKGDTAAGGSKAAVLETGAAIRVPLFVNVKDKIKVDTRRGKYVSRA